MLLLVTLSIQKGYGQSDVPDHVVLTWHDNPSTTQSVSWRTTKEVSNAIAEVALATDVPYDTAGEKVFTALAQKVTTLEGKTYYYYTAHISNLLPNTMYRYRVGANNAAWSAWNHFQTASSKPEPFSFIYLGDIQNDIKSWGTRSFWAAFKKAPYAKFMLFAGDCVNRGHNNEQWDDWFGALGHIAENQTLVPVTGNHEYDPVSKTNKEDKLSLFWQPQFELPTNGPKGLEESVYYIDYPGMRLIVLNSFVALRSEENMKEQAAWLENALQTNTQKWTVVTFHHAMFSSRDGRYGDYPQMRASWLPILEKYKVDLVLMGHDHIYGRSFHQQKNIEVPNGHTGPVYVVSVAGPKMYGIKTEKRWMDRAAVNTQLYQVIDIDGDTLKFNAYTVTNKLYDAFELHKESNQFNSIKEIISSEKVEENTFPDGRYTRK